MRVYLAWTVRGERGGVPGCVIGRARETRQRVVPVYDAARRHAVSRLIIGNCDDACTTFAYDSLEDLASFIDREFGPSAAV